MAIINSAIECVKHYLSDHLSDEQIKQACLGLGHVWRNRKLNPNVTIKLFILQIMHKNISCRELRLIAEMDFTPTAYCKARKRLPIDVLKLLCEIVTASVRRHADESQSGLWCGLRTWMVDGTGVSMPDTPELQEEFGLPGGVKQGCGFPVAHLLFLMDVTRGFISDYTVDPCHTSDHSRVGQLHNALEPNDVLVGDRGFCSFVHFALLLQRKLHGVCRRHQKLIDPGRKKNKPKNMMRRVKTLGRNDHLVELRKRCQKPPWMSLEDWQLLPRIILLRQISYRVTKKGYRTEKVTVLTTLLDSKQYPLSALAKLYDARWQIEINIRHLKTTMGMDVLRCKDAEGIRKELWVYVLVYNLIQHQILRASYRQKVEPDRISFIDTLDAMRYNSSFAIIVLTVNPDRTGRSYPIEPRVIKRRKDTHSIMTRSRDVLREALIKRGKAVTC